MEKTKCIIIGSGPAGYTAAIYASRAGIQPILYQGFQPGGQLTITNEVENFPGYPHGIQGPEMMVQLQEQATRFGTDVRDGRVTKIDFQEKNHLITIEDSQTLTAQSIIIATGASAKWLGIPSEKKYNGLGVSACAVCDGFFFKNQAVAIVGGGDTACEEALYLSNLCSSVAMIVRRDVLRASLVMQNRVKQNPKIKIYWNTETNEILGDDSGVTGVLLNNIQSQEKTEIKIKGFFVAIGHQPNTELFQGKLEMDEAGYLRTQAGSTNTSLKGVFACGDVQDKIYRQAVTAAGTGCMAALDAERYLALEGLH